MKIPGPVETFNALSWFIAGMTVGVLIGLCIP